MRFSRIKNLQPRPAIGGYVKIGRTVTGRGQKGEYTRPDKLDHFEVTNTKIVKEGKAQNFEFDTDLMRRLIDQFEADDNLAMLDLCGGCKRAKELGFEQGLPRRLPILLPNDDDESIFPSRYAWYRGRTVFCEGDGEEAQRRKEEGDGFSELEVWPHPCGDECPDMQGGRCKPHAVLRMVAPYQQRVGTLYQFSTTSRNSFRSILGGIEWIRSLVGTVAWIPLFLEMTNRPVTTREGKNTTAWIVALFYPGSAQQLLQHGQQEWGAIAGGQNKMKQLLGSLDDLPVSEDDQEAVRLAEFGVDIEDAEVVEPAAGDDNAGAEPASTAQGQEAESPAASTTTEEPAKTTKKKASRKKKQQTNVVGWTECMENLVKADHPCSKETVNSWAPSKMLAANKWAAEEALAIEAADAGLEYERKLPTRPSFIPEYGEPEERARLGLDPEPEPSEPAAAEPEPTPPPAADPNEPPPHGDPVPPPGGKAPEDPSGATNAGEEAPAATPVADLTDEQCAALEELGWDGRGVAPTLDVPQCREVVALLSSIGLTTPQKCLEWIGQAIGRPVMKTAEISVKELLTLRSAVAAVKAELEKGADY